MKTVSTVIFQNHKIWGRFLAGVGSVLLVLAAGFTLVLTLVPTWGSTPAEQHKVLPGDQIVSQPAMVWDHAVTIAATPGQIWPWIIQIGDTRGAFYSFTFIEKMFDPDLYQNASRIHPEWQNPQPGQGIIGDMMIIQEYQAKQYMLATTTPKAMGASMSWVWALDAIDAGHTRLHVRLRMIPPPGLNRPSIGSVFGITCFMMEKAMIDGIQARSEGHIPQANLEWLEILTWMTALGAGIANAILFMKRSTWLWFLDLGLISIIILFVYTYVQPDLWQRIAIDLALVVATATIALRSVLIPLFHARIAGVRAEFGGGSEKSRLFGA